MAAYPGPKGNVQLKPLDLRRLDALRLSGLPALKGMTKGTMMVNNLLGQWLNGLNFLGMTNI